MERSCGPVISVCFGIILILACLSGCSKESVFLTDRFENDGRFRDTTLVAVDSDWANRSHSAKPGWLSKRLVVGAWQGYLARAFIGFSSLPDSGVEITNATLHLYGARVEGSVAGNEFGVFALTDTLDQLSLYWGSMPEHGTDDGVAFDPPAEPRTSVEVDITDIVSSWVSDEDTNLGLVVKLLNEEAPGGDVIVEFASREAPPTDSLDHRPALTIAYIDTGGISYDTLSVAALDVFADTLVTPFPADTLGILCGNGFPSRAFVRFDVSAVPVEATVTRAELKLTPNLDESSFDSITVTCHAVLSPGWTGYNSNKGTTGSGTRLLHIDSLVQGNTVDMVITPLIQPLVARQETSYGLLIKSVDETVDIDFVRFFSSLATDTLVRPRLEIDYVMPPSPSYREEQ
ncbi:MAG: DNRLRE domain-containing protein [Candidatus Eisenbacteria bacterium]